MAIMDLKILLGVPKPLNTIMHKVLAVSQSNTQMILMGKT